MASEAYENLVRALEDFAREQEILEEGWALGDWIIAVECVPFAPELAEDQRYAHITPQPTLPMHRLLGLLDVTDSNLRDG